MLREEEKLLEVIEEEQTAVDRFTADLNRPRRLLAELNNGANDNAWSEYTRIIQAESED